MQISATSALGGKQHQPAAAAKAPAKAQSKLGMPAAAPDIIASAQGPTPADLPRASSARTIRQRARQRHRARHHTRAKHHKAAPQTGPPSTDRFATSVPRPDAYIPPPKPVKQHKPRPRHHHHKVTTPTPEPTPQPEPTDPLANNQTTTVPTPQQITNQSPLIKKPLPPSLNVGDDQTNKTPDGRGSGCGPGGSGNDDNSQAGDQHSDDSQSDNQSHSEYQKAPDAKSLLGIFKKHRGGDYKD